MSYWREYWAGLDDAGHRYQTEEGLRFYARELRHYFPERPVRVLELGCGNGDLYDHLKSQFKSYVGIDFSQAMLAKYKAKCTDTALVQADVSRLPLGTCQYDVVLSTGVCQYLDKDMLRSNLEQVYHLLDTEGIYLIANIPDAQLRWFYYAGALRGDLDQSPWLRTLCSRARAIITRKADDGIGYWYSRRALCKLAAEYGFVGRTYSSANYEYRFHVVLRKQP